MSEEIDVDELLRINENDLVTELKTTPSHHYLLASLATRAEALHDDAVLQLEQYEVTLAKKLKEEHIAKNSGSKFKIEELKETEIKREYRGDAKWLELKRQELNTYEEYKRMTKAEKAMEMKHQSCMSINKRQTKDGTD